MKHDNIRLGPDVGKGILVWLWSAVFFILTILLRDEIDASLGYWLSISIWSAGLLLATAYLFPGAFSLKLDERGFTVTAFFKKQFVSWGDCSEFKIKNQRAKYFTVGRVVVYSSNSRQKRKKLFGLGSGRTDHSLGTWELDAESLCELMNERRQNFIESNKNNTPT